MTQAQCGEVKEGAVWRRMEVLPGLMAVQGRGLLWPDRAFCLGGLPMEHRSPQARDPRLPGL